jgi:hypothetical protein
LVASRKKKRLEPPTQREFPYSVSQFTNSYSILNDRPIAIAKRSNIHCSTSSIMASSSALVDPVTNDIPALGKSLYDACLPFMQQNSKKVFNQSSLLELGVIPNDDIQVLMQVTQRLINEKLFKYVQAEGLGWKLRTLEEAKKFVDLFPNLIPISC